MNHIYTLLKLISLVSLMMVICCSQHQNQRASGQTGSLDADFIDLEHPVYIAANDTIINKDYLLGRFNPSDHPSFMMIELGLTTLKSGWLRKDVHEAFRKMYDAALKKGIILKIVSATRNFDAQKAIWEAKWNGTRLVDGVNLSTVADENERARIILKYSSMPGTSRHHWGTDIDINSVEPEYFKKPKGKKEYRWLANYAAKYGFCQTYTEKNSLRPTGYEEEPWHWSYRPVSSELLKQYSEKVTSGDINGFAGDRTVAPLKVIDNYVMGINHRCR